MESFCFSCAHPILDLANNPSNHEDGYNKDDLLKLFRKRLISLHPDKNSHPKATKFTQLINSLRENIISYYDQEQNENIHDCEQYKELIEYITKPNVEEEEKMEEEEEDLEILEEIKAPNKQKYQRKKKTNQVRRPRINLKATKPPVGKKLEQILFHETHNYQHIFTVKWEKTENTDRVTWKIAMFFPEKLRAYLDQLKTESTPRYNHLQRKHMDDFLEIYKE